MIAITRCARARRRLEAFLDGELAERDVRRVEAHVASCPRCRESLESLRRADALVRGAAAPDPGEPYRRDFIPRLRARIAAEGEPGDAGARARRGSTSRRPRLTPVWSTFIGSVAVATLAFLVFYAGDETLSPPSPIAPSGDSPAPPPATMPREEVPAPAEDAVPEVRASRRGVMSPRLVGASPSDGTPSGETPELAGEEGLDVARVVLHDVAGGGGASGTGAASASDEPGHAGGAPGPEAARDASAPGGPAGPRSLEAARAVPEDVTPRETSLAPRREATLSVVAKGGAAGEMKEQAGQRAEEPAAAADSTLAASPLPPGVIAREVLAQVARLESEAKDAGKAPDYSPVRPVLEALEPAARHPATSGLGDSLAAAVLDALDRARR